MSDSIANVQAVISIAEPLILDVIGWFRRRSAESAMPPTDAEVIAYAKSKIQTLVSEADAFEAEGPTE